MLQSYIFDQYPDGKIRTARVDHICNGGLDGNDPGCGAQIRLGESYFDTGERDNKFRAGRFCRHCAQIGCGHPDLFDIAKNASIHSLKSGRRS